MIKAIPILLALTFGQAAFAEGLLEACPKVIDSKSYQPLKQYLLEKEIQGNYCQRLNNNEFVYTSDTNFYFCNFKAKDAPCSEDSSVWYPGLKSLARFSGENGKKFALFEASRLSRGIYSSGYHVFFLVPKTKKPRGYKILPLLEVGEYNGTYSDGGEVCSNLDKSDQAIEAIDSKQNHVILNEGKRNVGIRFALRVTSCETQKSLTKVVEYIWSGNDFVQSITNTK
jgi:hypothetical protein